METSKVTLKITLSTMWSIFWLSMLIALIPTAVVNLVTTSIGKPAVAGPVNGLLGIFISIFALKIALTKTHGGYSAALSKPGNESELKKIKFDTAQSIWMSAVWPVFLFPFLFGIAAAFYKPWIDSHNPFTQVSPAMFLALMWLYMFVVGAWALRRSLSIQHYGYSIVFVHGRVGDQLSDKDSRKEALERIGRDGFTELMFAAGEGDLSRVEQLLKSGEEVNKQDDKGGTALIYAVRGGYALVVQYLIDQGADPLIKTNRGKTAFDFAKGCADQSIHELLLARAEKL